MSGFDALMTGLAYSRGREADDAWDVARHNAAMVDEWRQYAEKLKAELQALETRHAEDIQQWRERSAGNAGVARAIKEFLVTATGKTAVELAGSEDAFYDLADKHAYDVLNYYREKGM